jgi:hypothetical protein
MMPKRTHLARRPHQALIAAALLGAFAISGCAAFNRGELTLVRNISFGQELLDLQRAKQAGAITEAEFEALKAKIMSMADDVEVVQMTNDYVPDQISKPDND